MNTQLEISEELKYWKPTAMGEWFMDNGMDALIIYDDLEEERYGLTMN